MSNNYMTDPNLADQLVKNRSEKFRTKVSENFLGQASSFLSQTWTLDQITRILDEAVRTLDHFPSIAQLQKIGESLSTPTRRYERTEYARFEHPWPARVVAVMHMIRDGNTERGFKFGLQSAGLTEETAWQLYEDFACGNWHTERSRKILAALKPARWVIGKTQQNGPEVPVQNAPNSNDVCLSKAIDDLFGVGQRDEG